MLSFRIDDHDDTKFNHKNYNFLDCDWFKKTPIFHYFTCQVVIGQFVIGQFVECTCRIIMIFSSSFYWVHNLYDCNQLVVATVLIKPLG